MMPVMNITICRIDDPPAAAFVDIEDALIVDPEEPWTWAIVEHGMISGEPSVALRLNLPDAGVVLAETSLASMITFLAGARGAFPEAFEGGAFAAPA